MDCDQVFMVLTSGPFPTGDLSDVQVELHLEACPACWRFAEALRPAHDVFEESVPASEGRDLPGYWGDAVPARTAVAQMQRTAIQTASSHRSVQLARAAYRQSRPQPGVTAWMDFLGVATLVALVSTMAIAATWYMQ